MGDLGHARDWEWSSIVPRSQILARLAVIDARMTTEAMPRDVALLLTGIGIAVIVAFAFLAFVAIS
jgi:hypothetical protein